MERPARARAHHTEGVTDTGAGRFQSLQRGARHPNDATARVAVLAVEARSPQAAFGPWSVEAQQFVPAVSPGGPTAW